MVIEFLVKLQTELLEEKINLEAEEKKLRTKIDENAGYIQRLKEEVQNEFHAFSPRRNEGLHNNIRACENDQILFLEEYEDVKKAMSNTASRLSDLNHVIKTAKNDAKEIDVKSIIQKIEFCTSLVELDPMRCKMELSSLVQAIRKMI